MNIKNILLIGWKKFVLILVLWFASVILHNLVSGLLGTEEAFFFIIAIFALPVYFLVSIIYSLFVKVRLG